MLFLCPNNNKMTVGQQIEAKRKELNISQAQLAEKCNLTQATVSYIENDKRLEDNALSKISEALGLTIKLEPKK